MYNTPPGGDIQNQIVLRRRTRTLVGPGGRESELPLLSLRLLDALAQDQPTFVDSATLVTRVWPGVHISPDALKQRVRLVRAALAEAGYDRRLLDSARGEGYALLAPLVEHAEETRSSSGEVPPTIDITDAGHANQSTRTRVVSVVVAVAVLSLIGASLLNTRGNGRERRLGPSPVRLAVPAQMGTIAEPYVRELANLPGVVLVRDESSAACRDKNRAHLCLLVERQPRDTNAVIVQLVQIESGATLLRAESLADAPSPLVLLHLSQFASPGVLRWLGGRTGRGDREFSAFRDGVLSLGTCRGSGTVRGTQDLRNAVNRAPNFSPLRSIWLLFAIEEAIAANDSRSLALLRNGLDSLLAVHPDLPLAQVAHASLLAFYNDPGSRAAAARALDLSPSFAAFVDTLGVPRVTGSAGCALR